MGVAGVAALLCAGTLAGAVGTGGGITSLISYPSLLAVGLAAFPANIANMVALVACWPGSAIASRPELQGSRQRLREWVLASAGGGALGAALLLSTSAGLFVRIVPFLVAGASFVPLLQRRLYAWQGHRPARSDDLLVLVGLFAAATYNGYFGAPTLVAALAFVLFTSVDWAAVLPPAVGMFAGSTIGPRIARRVPADPLRWVVALLGLGLAVWVWVHPG